jgi:hypothetical protein
VRQSIAILLLMLLVAATAHAAATTPAQIDDYLAKMKVDAKKTGLGQVEFQLGFPGATRETFMVKAMPQQKLVYIAILDVATILPGQGKRFEALAKLNFQLTVGKLEWDPTTNQVRLSYTFAGEQGVDASSFVAVIQTLLVEIESVRQTLTK